MRGGSLALTIDATHQSLEDRLRDATARTTVLGQPRDTYARTDAFLAATSRHLAAVDSAVLPMVRRRLPDGSSRVHEYLQQARRLEHSLAMLKARLYGEAHAVHASWPRVWTEVRRQLTRHNKMERALVEALIEELSPEERDDLAQSVYRSEIKAPTRPHPYTPHTGMAGLIARRLWAVADRFWDTAEGRVIPDPVRPRAHKADSLMAQYMLGIPHFDEKATVIEHRHRRHHEQVTPQPPAAPGTG